ncbi:MAG: GMC family oxidoreductase N-terminal domain-containing protein [Methyloceanibacter sp.]|nr:GMC family oxidoreductase N-terminal domain-containing protein [Methyloceanibacter sp.]
MQQSETLSLAHSALRPVYDVVVVGSGYGGGIAASRLARAGQHVCVLERGREVPVGRFPTRMPELRRELQVHSGKKRSGSGTGLYDVRLGSDINVVVGCGLGGGSLINAGVALRPDPRVFADSAWPDAIRDDGLLDIGFARAADMLRPRRYASAESLTKYQALDAAGGVFGTRPVTAPVTISFDGGVNSAGIDQPACTLCGDCLSGCNVGAKTSIAVTYLADAKTHGAEIFTELSVSHVEKRGSGWRVHFRPTGDDGDEAYVDAKTVFLGAGTLGSTEILLRSRERGLTTSDRLGNGFSANGDIIAFALGGKNRANAVGVGEPPKFTEDPVGASVAGQIELPDDADLNASMIIQEGTMPSTVAPLLPIFFIAGGRLLGAAQSLIKGVYKGPLAHLQSFFCVSHDDALGRLVLKDDALEVDWPDVADQEVYGRVDAALTKAAESVGGRYIKNPLAATNMGSRPATAHPLGGCGMGETAESGTVNHKCQVFANASGDETHAGLYVCDGSIMPRSLGCNPLLTISALAERAMVHFARDHDLGFDTEAIRPHAELEPTA